MKVSIARAIYLGWMRWNDGIRPSQVYYLCGKDAAIMCCEGDDRKVVAEAALRNCRAYSRYIPCATLHGDYPGTEVKRRIAARLGAFAGYEAGGYEMEELIEEVLNLDVEVELDWWPSAREAYLECECDSAACTDICDYSFTKSCMTHRDVGRVYDLCSQYRGCARFKNPRDGKTYGRANVWHLPDGGLAVENIFNVPPSLAASIVRLLEREGIDALNSHLCSGDHGFDAGLAVPPGETVRVGYCDHLAPHMGNGARVFPFREGSYTGDITFMSRHGCDDAEKCDECEWGYHFGECNCNYCNASYNVPRCPECGDRMYEEDDGYGPNDEYCSERCANANDYYSCRCCNEWYNAADDGCGHGNDYCCDSCAESDGERACDYCGCWVDPDDHVEHDGKVYCGSYCAEEAGLAMCQWCRDIVSEEDAVEATGLTYCNAYCAARDGRRQCPTCDTWCCEEDMLRIGDEWYCDDACVKYHYKQCHCGNHYFPLIGYGRLGRSCSRRCEESIVLVEADIAEKERMLTEWHLKCHGSQAEETETETDTSEREVRHAG